MINLPGEVDYSDLDITSQDREVIECIAECRGWNACLAEVHRLNATAPPVSDGLYRIANHIAGAKNTLPQEWQDWAEEIESDLRKLAAAPGGQDS